MAAENDTTVGWVVEEKGKEPVLREFKLRPLGALDVEVEIIASGLCLFPPLLPLLLLSLPTFHNLSLHSFITTDQFNSILTHQ